MPFPAVMFNVLLDPLPDKWNGYRIDPAFQNGIQIMQVMSDKEISERERVGIAAGLLFVDPPESPQEALEGIRWFMTGWNHDHLSDKEKDKKPVMDWNMDQWRIYSAFRQHYGINLNDLGKRCIGYELREKGAFPLYEDNQMHFWEFMGLLTTLPDCAFTHVADIRAKELTAKMDTREKAFYRQAKKKYAIVVMEAETKEDIEAVEEFRRLAGLG